MEFSSSASNRCFDGRTERQRKIFQYGVGCIAISLIAVACGLFFASLNASTPNLGETGPSGSPSPNPTVLWSDPRLPKTLKPIHYKLHITPDLTNFTFFIKEEVEIEVIEATDLIVMHQVGLKILDSTVSLQSGSRAAVAVSRVEYNEDLQYVYFVFPELSAWFKEGERKVKLSLSFSGNISENLSGFYKSFYIENGQTEWMALTDFEPTKSRQAFVNFDEPEMKAQWSLRIVVSPPYTALSNMPHNETVQLESGQLEYRFPPTVRMSSYLVCFIVSKFQALQDNTSLPTLVRVWSTPATVNQTAYALTVAVAALSNYTKFFGIPFPLPKLDLIAIPDYPQGAMENWGLITFAPRYLLFDPEVTSAYGKQNIAAVVCHEISHQWFGNLVTMSWWSDLWLNEGFATFMEYLGVNSIQPDWEMWAQFLVMDKREALGLDSLNSTHPVKVELQNAEEIVQQFDSISYAKGGSIIRMLEAYLNQKDTTYFSRGLKLYLETHEYGNAVTEDLWKSLAEVSGDSNLPEMMQTWTNLKGFPLINVTWNSQSGIATISQQQFVLPGTSPSSDLWWVPILARTGSGRTQELALKKERQISISFADSDGFLLCNLKKGSAFYRVQYSSNLMTKISQVFKQNHKIFEVEDRISVLDDISNLYSAGLVSADQALDFWQYLRNEEDPTVFWLASDLLLELDQHLEYESFYSDFLNFATWILDNEVKRKLNSTDSFQNDHITLLTLPVILEAAASFGHPAAVSFATDLFQKFQDDPVKNNVQPELRSYVYQFGIQYGDVDDWKWLLRRANESQDPIEALRCWTALASTTEPYLLRYLLELSLDKNVVRTSETASIFAAVAENIYGRDIAWDFLRENFALLQQRYAGGFFLGRMVSAITSTFRTELKLKEVENFFAENEEPSISRTVAQSIERIQSNIRWIQTNRAQTKDWLGKWSSSN